MFVFWRREPEVGDPREDLRVEGDRIRSRPPFDFSNVPLLNGLITPAMAVNLSCYSLIAFRIFILFHFDLREMAPVKRGSFIPVLSPLFLNVTF